MRVFFRMLAFVATALFIIATVIKFTQSVSYKEAMRIMEEFCKEMMSKCRCYKLEENAAEESASPNVKSRKKSEKVKKVVEK